MRSPAEVTNDTSPRRLTHTLPERIVGERHDGVVETSGLSWIVKHSFAAVFHQTAQPREGRRDDRQAGSHVLVDLQRRPVKAEPEWRVAQRVEGRDADISRRQCRRQLRVGQGARERHPGKAARDAFGGRPLRTVADKDRTEAMVARFVKRLGALSEPQWLALVGDLIVDAAGSYAGHPERDLAPVVRDEVTVMLLKMGLQLRELQVTGTEGEGDGLP